MVHCKNRCIAPSSLTLGPLSSPQIADAEASVTESEDRIAALTGVVEAMEANKVSRGDDDS